MRSAADASVSWTASGRSRPRPAVSTVALCFLAVTLMAGLVALSAAEGLLAWDVRFAYLPAVEAILDGVSPYPALDDPILDEQKGFVYPPQLLFLLIPLAPLPVGVASALVAALLLGLVALTLWVLEVRDIRCYAAAYLWVPTISGVLLGNISIPLACALALLWRYRASTGGSAVALGLAVAAKLLLWPMYVWMLATRRLRAMLLSLAIGLAVTVGAWAVIGFAGWAEYPDLVRRLSDIQSGRSYSLVGMAEVAGLGEIGGRVVMALAGGALLAGCVAFARRGDDARSFACAVAATLVLSPIVWLHYLVVLLVPLAILRPRFSALWLLPVLLWVSPKPGYAEGFQTFMPLAAAAILVGFLLARPGMRGDAGTPAHAGA